MSRYWRILPRAPFWLMAHPPPGSFLVTDASGNLRKRVEHAIGQCNHEACIATCADLIAQHAWADGPNDVPNRHILWRYMHLSLWPVRSARSVPYYWLHVMWTSPAIKWARYCCCLHRRLRSHTEVAIFWAKHHI